MKAAALPWFRVYTKMVDDEKLRLLAFEDRWHFMALLCLKGQGVLDDQDPLMMRKAAVKMGLDVRTLEEVARRLAEVGLIVQATLQPIKWDDLQQRSDADSTAAERKRRQRQRQREEAEARAAEHSVAQGMPETGQNVTDTDESRVMVTNVTRTDIDRDIDKDNEEAKASLSTSKLPDCPHTELIDLFGQKLPMLPQPKPELWDGARAKALKARWAWVLTAKKRNGVPYATDRASALAYFARFFAYVATCPHLVGDNDRGWTADLAWLSKPDNFAKVVQGNYEQKQLEAA